MFPKKGSRSIRVAGRDYLWKAKPWDDRWTHVLICPKESKKPSVLSVCAMVYPACPIDLANIIESAHEDGWDADCGKLRWAKYPSKFDRISDPVVDEWTFLSAPSKWYVVCRATGRWARKDVWGAAFYWNRDRNRWLFEVTFYDTREEAEATLPSAVAVKEW